MLSVLLILTSIVNGQVNKLSLGIVGSPDFYNYQLKSVSGFDHESKTRINFSLGLTLNYNFTTRIYVKSGLLFSTKGYQINYAWRNIGANDPSIPQASKINLSYIELPVMVAYQFAKYNRMSFYASTGIVNSFLINENETTTMGDGSEKATEFSKSMYHHKFNKTLFSIDLELGLKYNLNERVYLSIAPYLRYGVNKISDELLASNPMSYGARLGLHYRL